MLFSYYDKNFGFLEEKKLHVIIIAMALNHSVSFINKKSNNTCHGTITTKDNRNKSTKKTPPTSLLKHKVTHV